MAFIIIYQAMQRNRQYYSGPQRPPTRGEKIALIIFLVVLLIGLSVGGVLIWKSEQKFNAHRRQVEQSWDIGVGRPEAASIPRGKAATAPATIKQISQYWDGCTYKTCDEEDIYHYPMAYPIGSLDLDHGCYTDSATNQVSRIMVASTKGGGSYSVALSANGKMIRICVITAQHDDDQLVIWSNGPTAIRD